MHVKFVRLWAASLVMTAACYADCTLINADQQKTEQLTVQEWSLEGAFSATHADGQLVVMPTRSVFMLRQNSDKPATPSSTGGGQWQLLLRQGDVLIGAPIALKENSLVFESRSLGTMEVPLKSAALLIRQSAAAASQPQPAVHDTLRLKNGDKVEGLLAAISGQNVQIQSDLGPTTVELDRVDRLIFAGVPTPSTDQLAARVYLADGTRFTTTRLKWLLNEITLNDPAGTERKVSANVISGVDILGGQACSLTDMTPSENTQQPYLGPTRPARINRNSAGGPLTIGGTTYERGIGMQAAGKVTYTINGAFDKLTFSVGIDDSAIPMGRANVSIWADGRQIFQKTALAAGSSLQDITLNIKNANTLELRADYLNNLDVQARVDWINPVLRRP